MHQPGRQLEASRDAFGSVRGHVNAQPPWVVQAAGDAQFLPVTNVHNRRYNQAVYLGSF